MCAHHAHSFLFADSAYAYLFLKYDYAQTEQQWTYVLNYIYMRNAHSYSLSRAYEEHECSYSEHARILQIKNPGADVKVIGVSF